MKRNNIYVYEYKGDTRGRNVGFCRMDFVDKKAKISLSIREDMLGIEPEESVDIKAELLKEGGKKQEFTVGDRLIEVMDTNEIVGVSVVYMKKNGIKIKVQGLLDNKEFIESVGDNTYVEKQELLVSSQENKRVQQIELEDTVYNVDMECIKEKMDMKEEKQIEENTIAKKKRLQKSGIKVEVAGIERELIKFRLDELVDLPREYWHLVKNKFVICGCNRYGHLAYMKQGEKYIICVPGVLNDKISGCARRFGFKSFFRVDDEVKGDNEVEENVMGYWMMSDRNK